MVGTRGVIVFSVMQSVRAVSMYADGKVHPECCLMRQRLTFACGIQAKFGNRSTATAVQIGVVASKCDIKKSRVHDLAYAVVEREGDRGCVDGSLQSSAGISQRASPAARGDAADSPGHVACSETFH